MATPGSQRLFSPPQFGLQSTPPTPPSSQSQQPRFQPSAASHTSPIHTRYNPMFATSPRYEHLKPTGSEHQFSYTRPQADDALSQASSMSGDARASSPEPSDDASQDSERRGRKSTARPRIVEGTFEVEEVEDEGGLLDTDAEIIQPDTTEEVSSLKSEGDNESMVENLERLRCDDSDAEREEQARRYRRKKKRWSKGQYSYKRSHSQSVGSDTDNDDEALDAHDVGSSARRLRRRVRGPGDRSSLHIDDAYEYRLHEVEEPTDEGIFGNRPPSIPSDGEIVPLEQLPFWSLDPMVIDSDSSLPSTRARPSQS